MGKIARGSRKIDEVSQKKLGDDTIPDDPLQFIVQHLEKGASRDAHSDFLEYFNFVKDPFDPSLPLIHLKETLIVSQRQANLFEQVGRIIEGYRKLLKKNLLTQEEVLSIHGLLRGPKGIGKTILLQVLKLGLLKTRHVPLLKPAFLSMFDLLQGTSYVNDAQVRWQRWLADLDREMSNQDGDFDGLIIFVDDLEYLVHPHSPFRSMEQLIWSIKDVFDFNPLIIGAIATRAFHWLMSRTTINQHPNGQKIIFQFIAAENMLRIPLMSSSDIQSLLWKRLVFCSSSVPSWVSPDVFSLVGRYSAGIPELAMDLFYLSLKHLRELGAKKLQPKHVVFAARINGFLDLSTSAESSFNWRDLSDRQKQVLFLLLQPEASRFLGSKDTQVDVSESDSLGVGGFTNKQLASLLGINLSTLTYHLKPLLHSTNRASFLLTRRNDDDNRSKLHYLHPRAVPVVEALLDGDLTSIYDAAHVEQAFEPPLHSQRFSQ